MGKNCVSYLADRRVSGLLLQNFHYQTDGWLSAQSARLYDFQVEMPLGSADARPSLRFLHIADFMRNRDERDEALRRRLRTGRFLSFVRDNHPELKSTALELSPHYLEATRKLNKRFEGKGGSLRLVEANAEDMPLEDDEFDMITNVYLFHELLRAVRSPSPRRWRVLKPGGKLFFVDSVQLGDGKENGMEDAFGSPSIVSRRSTTSRTTRITRRPTWSSSSEAVFDTKPPPPLGLKDHGLLQTVRRSRKSKRVQRRGRRTDRGRRGRGGRDPGERNRRGRRRRVRPGGGRTGNRDSQVLRHHARVFIHVIKSTGF